MSIMEEAYEEIGSAASSMDLGRLESVFEEMKEYRIPASEAGTYAQIEKAFAAFDYDGIVSLIDKRTK